MIPAIFRRLCPDSDEDLVTHEDACASCLPESRIWKVKSLLEEYERFFEACIGSRPWSIQRTWARRVLLRESFAMLAPTGVGKTAFGLVTSLFHHHANWGRSYVIVPTVLLVQQSKEDLEAYAQRALQRGMADDPPRILAYWGGMSKKEKEETLESISSGDFDVLVTTSQFLSRNLDLLLGKEYGFIFVDDVDSLLKTSKNIDRVLMLIGFDEKDIKLALRDPTYRPEKGPTGSLVLSTATGRPGPRAILFRRLLGFDIGALRGTTLRNVEDIVVRSRQLESLTELVSRMGDGGIVLLADMSMAEQIKSAVEAAGVTAEVVVGSEEEAIRRFAAGEIGVLIGAAKPYGVLVRGLDLPERVRYALFYSVPRFSATVAEVEQLSERALAVYLGILSPVLGPKAAGLSRRLRLGRFSAEDVEEAKKLVAQAMSDPSILEKVSRLATLVVETTEQGVRLVIPDVRTYIQGSGRTSRLYPGGLTRGVSFLLDEGPLLDAFLRRASAYELEFKDISEVDLNALMREIDEDRRRVREAARGEVAKTAELLKTALFIVESPNKARTIARFFGRPSRRIVEGLPVYEVCAGGLLLTIAASGGHVVDLTTVGGYHGVLIEDGLFIPVYTTRKRCRSCGHQFTDFEKCPHCGSEDLFDSRESIEVLRKLAFEAGKVIIATDPDTEGEKIAWDLAQLLSMFSEEVWRAEFHEVTKRAISDALKELHQVSEPRVKAQIVRRIEDRWIGFELSQELQRVFKNRNLSAGRAQTPTLGWIIQRYHEYVKRKDVTLVRAGGLLRLTLEGKVGEQGPATVDVVKVGEEEVDLPPLPPFTTDEMLREASRILKLGAKETMAIAQELFEAGLITYHRTDSARVSDAGLRVAREYLREDFVPRRWGEGGAHECIRPTKPLPVEELIQYLREGLIPSEGITRDHLRLYRLIFNRFMASQSAQARVRKAKYVLTIADGRVEVERIEEVLIPGWSKYYPYGLRLERPLPEGPLEVEIKHLKVPGAPLYSQGDVIRLMKEKGIGRPSTYATIIDRLLTRRYVVDRRGKLFPTKRGIMVYDYLISRYPDLVSEERTADLEERMEAVEEGLLDYQEVLADVYSEIRSKVGGGRGS